MLQLSTARVAVSHLYAALLLVCLEQGREVAAAKVCHLCQQLRPVRRIPDTEAIKVICSRASSKAPGRSARMWGGEEAAKDGEEENRAVSSEGCEQHAMDGRKQVVCNVATEEATHTPMHGEETASVFLRRPLSPHNCRVSPTDQV